MLDLTIVSSCCGYGKYLAEWAASIAALTVNPTAVCLFTHGLRAERDYGAAAIQTLVSAGIFAEHQHSPERLDFGTARNRAVAMSSTEWVMHLDADDMLMPHALKDVRALAPSADVIALGYERCGDLASGPSNRLRIYSDTQGAQTLAAAAPASGVSPFRRALWEQSPYRTDMRGAWDTALWIGFARLDARFRATKRPCFWYRQHGDSIFNKRRTTHDWTHALTVAQLTSLRRGDSGVAVVVPRDASPTPDRKAAWEYVRGHYSRAHAEWSTVEGVAASDPWCKGEAVHAALTRCSASTLVIADADCIVPPDALRSAVEAVGSGRAPWAVPHGTVYRLNAEATARVLAGETPDLSAELDRPPYQGFAGGGVVIVPRPVYEASGGIPLAFRGWGAEDEAFAVILDCLAGPHLRGSADLLHLYHEPQPTKSIASRSVFAPGNRQTYRLVAQAAKRGEDALWTLLQQLKWTRPRKGRTEAEIAERRRRQSFLGRRGG